MAIFNMSKLLDKQTQVVFFSATAIALYGYDQGTSLIPKSAIAAPLPIPHHQLLYTDCSQE
jgi:hypothetical protein